MRRTRKVNRMLSNDCKKTKVNFLDINGKKYHYYKVQIVSISNYEYHNEHVYFALSSSLNLNSNKLRMDLQEQIDLYVCLRTSILSKSDNPALFFQYFYLRL